MKLDTFRRLFQRQPEPAIPAPAPPPSPAEELHAAIIAHAEKYKISIVNGVRVSLNPQGKDAVWVFGEHDRLLSLQRRLQ